MPENEVERLKTALRQLDRVAKDEADELRTANDKLREAITEALGLHVYTFDVPDEDGNIVRAEKVQRILQGALDA